MMRMPLCLTMEIPKAIDFQFLRRSIEGIEYGGFPIYIYTYTCLHRVSYLHVQCVYIYIYILIYIYVNVTHVHECIHVH